MEAEHIPSFEEGSALSASVDLFLFPTDPEAPVTPCASPASTSINDTIDKLSSQLSYYCRRRQRVEIDKTLLEILRLHAESHSEMVLDTLERALDGLFSYTSAVVKDFEKCTWETFLYLQKQQPDSFMTLSMTSMYCRFLMKSRIDLQELSRERLIAVAEFLAPRSEKLLAEVISALVANLDGTVFSNAHTTVVLENATNLLKQAITARHSCCSEYLWILKSHTAICPNQRKVTEKLLKLAIFESRQERKPFGLYQCTEVFLEKVIERNYESGEAIEVWFANSPSLAVYPWMMRGKRAFRLRQFYRSK